MTTALLLKLMLVIPLLGAIAIIIAGRRPNLREAVTLLCGLALFLTVLELATTVSWQEPVRVVLAEPVSGLQLMLSPEPLGVLFALVAGFLWPVTSVYSIGYMRRHGEVNQTRFYAAFALSIGAVMGIAMAGNMLTLFLFYELLTIFTYPLVTHAGTDEARRAGRVYLGLLLGTSISFLLLAMIWTWQLTGTLEFTDGGIFAAGTDDTVLGALLLLFVLGTGKAALMPFHRWLPAAMVAPTPVSALLHAVAVVKAGVFTVLKIAVYLFGMERMSELATADWLAWLAGASILAASLIALTRDNLKARLAYSTVSQLGYIVLGAMLGATAGVVGGGMHIAMHAFGKITLFFCAGAILVTAHKTRVSELDGIGRQMPLTMLAFLLGALSIVGVPPMGGTWSKWLLVQATLDANQIVLTAVLLLSSLLNVVYLVSIPVRGFFGAPDPARTASGMHEAPVTCLLAIAVTAAGCIVLFFTAEPLYELASEVLR